MMMMMSIFLEPHFGPFRAHVDALLENYIHDSHPVLSQPQIHERMEFAILAIRLSIEL